MKARRERQLWKKLEFGETDEKGNQIVRIRGTLKAKDAEDIAALLKLRINK